MAAKMKHPEDIACPVCGTDRPKASLFVYDVSRGEATAMHLDCLYGLFPHVQIKPLDRQKSLHEARLDEAWTARALARQTGLSEATIYNIESGRTQWPGQDTRERLEAALECPIDWIKTRKETRIP